MNWVSGKYALTEEEKEAIRQGLLTPSGKKNRIAKTKLQDMRIQSFINRSQGQLNSPDRLGGNKLGSKRKKATGQKKAASAKGICPKPPKRRPSLIAEDNIQPQTANVITYLDHIRSIPANTYSQFLNACWGDERISEEGYRILQTLPKTPTYALRYVNRIFSYDSWQTIPREDRPIVFDGCYEADFTSLHFQIFMMILRKYLPEDAAQIQGMMGDKTIWEWWADQGIGKEDVKTPVQMLINCKSASNTRLMIKEPERQDYDEDRLDEVIITRRNEISAKGELWIKTVNASRNKITRMIETDKIQDAFGNPLPRLTSFEYFQLKREWKPFWKLVRTDLNALYSSYELKLLTDSVAPTIRGYERFKVVIHLHDGFLFQVSKKYREQVFRKLKNDSDAALKEMDIYSKLNLPSLDQVVPT